jgi:pyrroloquinoline quinone biosynthesis protein D
MPTPTHPKPAGRCQGQDLGDEYLFYDRSGDQFHVLNGTAREIFLLCDGTRTPDEIVRAFAERYDIDPGTAVEDARQTLRQLADLGLLTH